MPAKKKGRDRPERIGEPQEDDTLAAAQDQTKACPQSVFVDDNPSDFDGQIAGGVPESETGPGGGEEGAVEGNLMDTGVAGIPWLEGEDDRVGWCPGSAEAFLVRRELSAEVTGAARGARPVTSVARADGDWRASRAAGDDTKAFGGEMETNSQRVSGRYFRPVCDRMGAKEFNPWICRCSTACGSLSKTGWRSLKTAFTGR